MDLADGKGLRRRAARKVFAIFLELEARTTSLDPPTSFRSHRRRCPRARTSLLQCPLFPFLEYAFTMRPRCIAMNGKHVVVCYCYLLWKRLYPVDFQFARRPYREREREVALADETLSRSIDVRECTRITRTAEIKIPQSSVQIGMLRECWPWDYFFLSSRETSGASPRFS